MNLVRTIAVLAVAAVSPLMAEDSYDLVIAGGTLDAVRLAVSEAAAGRKVYLVAPRPYLGEERRSKLDLLLKLIKLAEVGKLSGLLSSV